jgi:polysaccharide biosynthesis transport protein
VLDQTSFPTEPPTLKSYVWPRKWSVFLVTLLVVTSGMYFSFQATPIYQSEAKVLVRTPELDSDAPTLFSSLNMDTERNLGESEALSKLVKRDLETRETAEALADDVSVDFTRDTEILTFGYEHQDPAVAQERAQAFAEAYLTFRERQLASEIRTLNEIRADQIEVIRERLQRVNRQIARSRDSVERSGLRSQANLLSNMIVQREIGQVSLRGDQSVGTVIQPAHLPTAPIRPNHLIDGLLALMLGMTLGVSQAIVRGGLDQSTRGIDELERLFGVPVLATIPRVDAWSKEKQPLALTNLQWPAMVGEAYRVLRSNFLAAAARREVKTVMVTSGRPGEGKTTTAGNLSLALTQAGKKVVLVSADMRTPQLHSLFGIQNGVGLGDLLRGDVGIREALVRYQGNPNLALLPAGSNVDHPAELLASNAMSDVLERLGAEADHVIIDALPMTTTADSVSLAPVVEAVLFVTEDEKKLTRGQISYIRRQLDQVQTEVIGIVLNRFEPVQDDAYAYYGPAPAEAPEYETSSTPRRRRRASTSRS